MYVLVTKQDNTKLTSIGQIGHAAIGQIDNEQME